MKVMKLLKFLGSSDPLYISLCSDYLALKIVGSAVRERARVCAGARVCKWQKMIFSQFFILISVCGMCMTQYSLQASLHCVLCTLLLNVVKTVT